MRGRWPVRFTERDGTHIAYQVRGDGPRDFFFVPPWFSNLDLLEGHGAIRDGLDRLMGFARIITFDRRGAGLSDRMCGPAPLEENVGDVLAVMDAAGSERATLFGMNEAGALSAVFAATHPERVSSLILYGSYAATLWQPDYPWAPRPEEREQEVQALIAAWGTETIVGLVSPSRNTDREFLSWAMRWMRGSVSKDALPIAYELLSKTDVRQVLATINVPTLVLHRTNDPVVAVDNGRYLAEHIPGARYVELPGDDHLPFLGEWASLADEIQEFLTGERPHDEHHRVLATILFTDIVDSSGKLAAIGDTRWSKILDRYEEILREEVVRFQGRVVKTIGDGALATFDGPARAIRCACRLSDRLEDLDITIRSGIHTGEVERRGDDLSGIAVHIAARVSELAGASEVLVSGAVPPLVAGAGIEFEDRGVRELPGIPGEWRVLKVAL